MIHIKYKKINAGLVKKVLRLENKVTKLEKKFNKLKLAL